VLGNPITYTVSVTNKGPSAASGVTVTNVLPLSAPIVSATASQGAVTISSNIVVCRFGGLGNGGQASATIVVAPTAEGTLVTTSRVTGDQSDPVQGNNSATVTVTVNPAADLALTMNAMAGFDPRDSTSLERPKEDYGRFLSKEVQGLRIGLPKEYFGDGIEAGVRAAVEEAVRWLEAHGAKRVPIELPNTGLAVPVYYVIAPAEASSNLARFDGVRYGHRAKDYADLNDMYCRTRAEGFGAEVKRRILVGTYVLSHGYYDAYYLQAQKIRRLIARDFAAAFERCDVILGPTSPTTAFAIGEKSGAAADPVQMYLNDIFTIPAPLAGLPGLSIPCGFDPKGLPVGLQLMGDYFSEARLLGVAHRYQQATDWHLKVPTGTPL